MKLETFFERFDQFADAPDAVAKMRALVLQLAVRGKLVDQNSDEGTADALIEQMTNMQKQHGSSIAMRDEENGAPPSVAGWFDVPPSWRWVRFKTVGKIVGGGTPRSDNPEYFADNGIPWLTPADLNGFTQKNIVRGRRCITKIGLENSSAQLLPAGSVLFSSRAPIGYVAIAGVDLATNQGFKSCVPYIKETNEFLYLFLLSAAGRIDREASGTTFREVSGRVVGQIPIPLPPLAEQKRIVAKTDELMALCDRLEAQQKERETRYVALARAAIARFDEAPTSVNLNFLFHPSYSVSPTDLRKTILNLAIQGNLVSAQCDTGDLGAIFDGLVTIKQRANEETSLPKSWALASYRNLTSLVTSGSRGWKEFYSGSGSIFVRTQNIKTDRLVLDDIAYVSLPDSVEGLRAQIKKNDILITITGANVTKAARVEDDISEAYVSQHIALTRPRWPDMSPWLHLCFIAPGAARGKLEALAYGDKPGLNLNNIRDLVFPIPPLSEQRLIISEVDRLMEMVGRLEELFTESQLQAKHLLDAVVHELLYPTAEVVEFPGSESDRTSERAAIGCYAIEHLLRNPSFGHTMNMKVVYMAQAHIGLPLDLKFERQAAGPWHPWIEEFDTVGQSEGWFTVTQKPIGNGHTKYEYAPKAALKQKVAEAAAVLGKHKAEFDRLLGLFADLNTEKAEIVATLFAAWNDFLIDGKTPTDDEIIREVRENWHESKRRFTPTVLADWLKWMRKHRLVPQGRGPRTQQQLTLALN